MFLLGSVARWSPTRSPDCGLIGRDLERGQHARHDGLVDRRRESDDRRVVTVYLANDGAERLEAAYRRRTPGRALSSAG